MTAYGEPWTRKRGIWAVKHTAAVYLLAHAIFAAFMAVSWVFFFQNRPGFAVIVFLSEMGPFQNYQLIGSWPLGLGCYLVALPATLLGSRKIADLRGDH